ncbi:MAG: IPT/TIG domain-containing protein, partial [Thermaerobacter sp.]|nr:IPT/TIG domain-containing protein [Thermaerobacter sp.]
MCGTAVRRRLLAISMALALAGVPGACAMALYIPNPVYVNPNLLCLSAAPTVAGISPNNGPSGGGTTITITGTCLGGTTAVTFSGISTTAPISFTVVSQTQVTAVSPPGTGTVDVTVTTPNGTSAVSSADRFTYQSILLYSVTPGYGPPGTSVTITPGVEGLGFVAGGVSQVDFVPDPNSPVSGCPDLSVPKADFTSLSDGQITVPAPYEAGVPLADCLYDVQTTPTSVPASFNLGVTFMYLFAGAVPMVTSVLPGAGGAAAGGTSVTIEGFGFTGATAVSFGPNAAQSFQVVSDGQITAVAPPGSGTVRVSVSSTVTTSPPNPNGGDTFTYAAPVSVPTVTGVSPQVGDAAGGTVVSITGTGFTPAMAVVFGSGHPADGVTFVSDTELTAVSPPHAPGPVDVLVGGVNAASAPNPTDKFIFDGLNGAGAATITPPPPPAELLYVANTLDGTVSVLNGATNTAVSTINLNVGPVFASLQAEPFGLVADPRLGRVYVTVGTVAPPPAGSVTFGAPQPPYDLVEAIDTDPTSAGYNTVTAVLPLGPGGTGTLPGQPALSPDGRYLYVPRTTGGYTADANGPTNAVVVLDTSAVTASLDPTANAGVVVDTIQALEPWSGRKDVIGPNAGKIDPVSLSGLPDVAVASPDGKRVYVLDAGEVCFRSSCGAGQGRPVVAVIDTDPASPTYNTVTAEVALHRGHAAGLALSPGGRRLYALVNPVTAQTDAPVEVIDTTQIQPGLNGMAGPAVYASLLIEPQDATPCGNYNPQIHKTVITGGVVVASDLGLSPGGSLLYVSDYMGPLWVIATDQIQPGVDNALAWWAQAEGCPQSGSSGTGPSPVVGALVVGGQPNAVAVDAHGTVYVASGGRSTGLELDEYYNYGSTPGNRVTVIIPYSLPPGPNARAASTDPANTLGPSCTAPCVSTVGVGQYPKALVIVPQAPPAATLPGPVRIRRPVFTDLSGYAWAAPEISELAQAGVISGVAPGRFDPGGDVTRVQLAAMLTRMFRLAPPASAPSFNDVPAGYWGRADVQAAAPFLPPLSAGRFGPDAHAQRQDVAAAVVRVLVRQGKLAVLSPEEVRTVLARVGDADTIDPSLQTYVATAIQAGIVKGFPDGSFQPQGVLNRAQAAVLLDGAAKLSPAHSGQEQIVTQPAVSSVSPAAGAGGTQVVIGGIGFTGATEVSFGSVSATSFQVVSDGEITAA